MVTTKIEKNNKEIILEKLLSFNKNLTSNSSNGKQIYDFSKLIKQQQCEILVSEENLPYVFRED